MPSSICRAAPLLFAVLAVSSPWGPADAQTAPERKPPSRQSADEEGQGYSLAYESEPQGRTLFRILAPESAALRVTSNGRLVLSDTVPAAFEARAGHFYRVEILSGDAVLFDRKFEAREGKVAQLRVAVVPPPAVTCLGPELFAAVADQVEEAGFSRDKRRIVETAFRGRTLCVAQVVQTLGWFGFSEDKLAILGLLAPHVSDPQNHFRIFPAFRFSADKEKARRILEP